MRAAFDAVEQEYPRGTNVLFCPSGECAVLRASRLALRFSTFSRGSRTSASLNE